MDKNPGIALSNAPTPLDVIATPDKSDDDCIEAVVSINDASIPWDDPQEKRNPKCWPMPMKIFHTLIPCLVAFEV